MQFLLLLFLTSACLALQVSWWPPYPEAGLGESAGLIWLAMAGVVALAAVDARWTRRQLARNPSQREAIIRQYGHFRHSHVFLLFAAYGLGVAFLGWGWVVRAWCRVDLDDRTTVLLPGAELLLLAPFLLALVLSWACFYGAERAIHSPPLFAVAGERPYWGRWTYVGFHVRQNLALVLVPLLLLIVGQGILRLFHDPENDWLFQLAGLGMLVAAFIFMPWILRLVLGLRPLPEGPLRERLLTVARRVGFRFSNILLWNTHGGVANAMVVGVLPWPRYVLLTDRLAEDLTPEEVEAVFGHEIGHVKHHHMLYYISFLMISLAVLGAAWALVFGPPTIPHADPELAGWDEDWKVLTLVPFLGAYIFVVFGFLSRRCERQADIYGCRVVSCPYRLCLGHDLGEIPLSDGRYLCPTGIRTFIKALEKVAQINGINRSRPGWLQSWQHSTIALRVDFLQRMLADPTLEPRFQRTVRLVKWVMLVGLSALLVAMLYWTYTGPPPSLMEDWERLLLF